MDGGRLDTVARGDGPMGLGLDAINALLIISLLVIVGALMADEFGQQLAPRWRRYRSRLLADHVTWRTFLPLVVAVALAMLMRAFLIGAYLLIVGILITVYFLRRAREQRQSLPARQILQLILAFRSAYLLQPSVFLSLDAVKEKVDEPLRSLMRVTVETYYLTSSPQHAFMELRARTDNIYLSQFAYVLEMSETARTEVVVKALDNLVERLRTHDQLRREIEASLVSITGQTSFIQVIAVLVVLGVAAVPLLRAAYTSPGGQIAFIIIISIMLGASYYIDSVINRLAERVS
jgi:Flp pilus assembly protein TadB